MSNWETAEQRQIRELRTRIYTVERQREREQQLRRDAERLRRELEVRQRESEQRQREILEHSRKLEQVIAANHQQLQALHTEVQEKERLQREKIEDMEREQRRRMEQIRQEAERENNKLRDTIVSTRKEMQEGFVQLREEREKRLAEQRVELTHRMQQSELRMQKKISAVDAKVADLIASIQRKENGERELAVYWTEQANRFLKEIEEHRPELFAPKETENLRNRLNLAESDLQNGRYTSAADGGRAVFYTAMDLKESVVKAELEWNYWYVQLKEKESELLELLAAAENRVYELELDGEQVEDTNGIDYWTNGQLSVVKKRIESFCATEKMEKAEQTQTEELKETLEKLNGLREELLQVENASHTNLAMSVNRYQLSARIGEILGEDYQMMDSEGDFFGEENREEYHAIFENPVTRDQVAVVITPVAGEDGVVSNHIELIIGNHDNNPMTREIISKSVQKKLNEKGILEGDFPCSQKYGTATAEEVKRVGNIAAVTAGNVAVRASTERVGITKEGKKTETLIRQKLK